MPIITSVETYFAWPGPKGIPPCHTGNDVGIAYGSSLLVVDGQTVTTVQEKGDNKEHRELEMENYNLKDAIDELVDRVLANHDGIRVLWVDKKGW